MKTIKFIDNGQDFLEWIIKDDVVIDCQPHQFKIWVGKKVKLSGHVAFIENENSEMVPIIHKIKCIEPTEPNYIKGYMDGLLVNKNEDSYQESQQYKYGFLVAKSSIAA
ncbi:MAG: hypothetical protein HRU24_13305 [Gammaproteobacteria bacterium]|nr:hypothetical protein [Gammaproteobacteria bacterium]